MHDVGLWLSFSSRHKQLSVALLKPLYLSWDLISIRPQVVSKVSHGKIRERSFHLTQEKCQVLQKSYIYILDLYASAFAVL